MLSLCCLVTHSLDLVEQQILYQNAQMRNLSLAVVAWHKKLFLMMQRNFKQYEPLNGKTQSLAYANREDTEQPAHPFSLI